MSAALMSYSTSNGTNGGSSSALELYFKDIAYSELLTPQEEIDLAKRIRAGDRKSLNKMIESNLRFVITIAKEYQGRGLLLEDLIAEGNMGLVRAATRYDETVGVKFTTYAVWWIRQGILSALAEKARMVRLPVNKIKHLSKLERISAALKQSLGREPRVEEIAAHAEMQPQQVQDLLSASRWHVSFDMPVEDGPDTSLLDMLSDNNQESPEEAMLENSMAEENTYRAQHIGPTRRPRVAPLFWH